MLMVIILPNSPQNSMTHSHLSHRFHFSDEEASQKTKKGKVQDWHQLGSVPSPVIHSNPALHPQERLVWWAEQGGKEYTTGRRRVNHRKGIIFVYREGREEKTGGDPATLVVVDVEELHTWHPQFPLRSERQNHLVEWNECEDREELVTMMRATTTATANVELITCRVPVR